MVWSAVRTLGRAAVSAARWVVDLIPDALLLGGAATVTYGAALVYRPAGWIVGGLLAVAAGWRLGRAHSEVTGG